MVRQFDFRTSHFEDMVKSETFGSHVSDLACLPESKQRGD